MQNLSSSITFKSSSILQTAAQKLFKFSETDVLPQRFLPISSSNKKCIKKRFKSFYQQSAHKICNKNSSKKLFIHLFSIPDSMQMYLFQFHQAPIQSRFIYSTFMCKNIKKWTRIQFSIFVFLVCYFSILK